MAGLRLAPPTVQLLRLYADPEQARHLRPAEWSAALGAARRSRTLGHLALRLAQAGVVNAIDPRITTHFVSASMVISQRRRMLRWEIGALADALSAAQFEIVVLKGAAYELQALPLASARVAADVDLLVSHQDLADIEHSLVSQGWQVLPTSDYDERYYREWSHELPAFAHPARGIEVDVHHSITPKLASRSEGMKRLWADSRPLLAASGRKLPSLRRFRTLSAPDQVIHAAVHTFGDSDLASRLREVMDFDCLYRDHLERAGECASAALIERAASLGLASPLWWALHFSARWLSTPVPPDLLRAARPHRPPRIAAMNWLADRAMLPGQRQWRTGTESLAETALLMRQHWQRMPLYRLAPHLARKSYLRIAQRAAS